MGSTLEHGIYLPSEGEKNCYSGLANNWQAVDTNIGYVTALRQAIAGALTRQIVTQLPTEDIDPNCIYMILKATAQTNNIYDEYMYINSNWELIGDSQLDLSNYYTKQEVNQLPAVASGVTSTKVGNYDTHIANGDIHVTVADKSKWDTVALIKQLRLVTTQVGSATTIAFANIDDTNGIKVGDKCMDLDGKMFEITAVDTANQTVSVTTPLTQLAVDSRVMHLTGNETATGDKTFSDRINQNVPFKMASDSSYITGSKTNYFYDQNSHECGIDTIVYNASRNLRRSWTLNNNSSGTDVSGGINFILSAGGTKIFYPVTDSDTDSGSSSAYWKNTYTKQINGNNPGSMSIPNLNNRLDISGYITNLSGAYNAYIPLVDGWIAVYSSDATFIRIADTGSGGTGNTTTSQNAGILTCMMPVKANRQINVYIVCTTLTSAYFIPCQGNV